MKIKLLISIIALLLLVATVSAEVTWEQSTSFAMASDNPSDERLGGNMTVEYNLFLKGVRLSSTDNSKMVFVYNCSIVSDATCQMANMSIPTSRRDNNFSTVVPMITGRHYMITTYNNGSSRDVDMEGSASFPDDIGDLSITAGIVESGNLFPLANYFSIKTFIFSNGTDETPPTVTVNPPVNKTAFNALTLNFTVSVTDNIATELICNLRNETTLLDTDAIPVSTPTNLTYFSGLSEIQQSNMYNITCFDGDETNNNSATVLLNITLDTVFPTIDITLPTNNSVIDKTFNNLTVDAFCTDRNAIAFNYTLINSTGDSIASFQNNTNGSQLNIKTTTSLKDIPTGNYEINFTCVDGHTYSDSKVLYYTKDELLNKVYYNTLSGNDISIQLYSANVPLCDFGSKSAPDREIFWYDFSCNKASMGINTYKFTLRDNDNELRYLKDSEYRSHFITKDNFITFQIDKYATYKITKVGKDYDIVMTTSETFLDFRHSIGGLNKFQTALDLEIIESTFASIEHFDIEIDDIILDSDTFVTVSDVAFNLSQPRILTMRNSLILTKFSLPQASEVTGRITFNNEVLFERSVSTVASLDTVRSINFIVSDVSGVAGTNNLTYEISEDGNGAINISNWKTHIITNVTSKDSEYGTTSKIIEETFSSLAFTNISTIPVNKAVRSKTYIDIANRLEADTATTITCLLDGNITQSTYQRRILSADDVASSGMSLIDSQETGTKDYHLNCSNTAGAVVSSNATFIALNLRDLSNNIINANFSSGSQTALSSGSHELAVINNMPVRNGNEMEITASVHLTSTSGDNTVAVTVNTSNNCFDSHRRSLATVDVGTVKFYTSCNSSGINFINITLGITIEAGESVVIVDEQLSAFEVASLNTSIANIAPLVSILSPFTNEILFSNFKIEWMTTEPNENNYITNITVVNSSDVNKIFASLNKETSNTTFNFSTLGEGDFTLNVISAENETEERLIGTASVAFTVRFPTISVNLTSPANASIDADGLVVFNFITDTGNSNNCSLFIDNTINNINQSINVTIGSNSFNEVRLANATHTWLVRCDNSSLTGVSEQFTLNVLIGDPNALSLTVCPASSAGMFKLVMIIAISLVFITLGFAFNVGIVGVFGAVMLMISSWFVSPCSNIFSFAMALLSGVLLIVFVIRGLVRREE